MKTSLRRSVLVAVALLSGCASVDIEDAHELEFARRLVSREQLRSTTSLDSAADTARATAPTLDTASITSLPPRTRADEWRGLLVVPADRLKRLEAAAAAEEPLDVLLREPLSIGDLATLAALRSPTVRKARARYEGARTAFSQSQDLGDLVALFRSFTRSLATRVGPERSRRATEMIAPSPNVNGISAEIAKRTADMAFESLRATTRDVIARAWKAHADAARLAEARRILREELELDAALLEVLRSRLESGTGSQSGFLAFESRLERMKTELSILDRRATVVQAAWNQLLSRPESAAVVIDVAAESAGTLSRREDEQSLVKLALKERQELRVAEMAARRAELGVRLAETMTLPRIDLGSSRFERERAGEASVQRGAVFPAPGRMIMPRWDFGVREAQVQEMRSRAQSMAAQRDALRDRVGTEARTALFDVDAASQRVAVHKTELVPLAQKSLEAVRGAYEGNRAGYLDLLDAVRRLLDARLGLADARRDLVRSQANLLRAVGAESPARR